MATCATCHEPLILFFEPSDDEEDVTMNNGPSSSSSAVAATISVPDDVLLDCGCHFHWQCLLDAYTVTSCPICCTDISSISSTGQQQVLCNLNNEGGLQERLNILPLLTEEGYLKAYPEERRCRAFLEFCREDDLEAILDLLNDPEKEGFDETEQDTCQDARNVDVLRYQDPLGEGQSGLHAAIEGNSSKVAWFLLFVASDYDLQGFPAEVLQHARAMGVQRDVTTDKVDIRTLRDSRGRTAEQLAADKGGIWTDWVGAGPLRMDES